jgi:NAD(P)-dependent dehydrogenase (short-subunit alcohol dehydrogenase family)
VRVNIVSPGPIITPGGDEVRKTITEAMGITDQQLLSSVPLEGRAGTAQELAEAITFLVSRRASYITGDTLFVGGGWGTLAAI